MSESTSKDHPFGGTAKTFLRDPRVDAYRSFFDFEWASQFLAITNSNRLQQASFDLVWAWKSTGFASQMPWLMIQSLKAFHGGLTKSGDKVLAYRVCSLLPERLGKEAGLSRSATGRLKTVIEKITTQVDEDMQRNPPVFEIEAIWHEHLKLSDFSSSLRSSQHMCYAAVCHAYENFLQQCVASATQQNEYMPSIGDMKKDFRKEFGEAMIKECFETPDLKAARLARNDIAHNGGRASKELCGMQHGLLIADDGYIHILPEHVRNLFDILKSRAMKMAEYAKANPKFALLLPDPFRVVTHSTPT